jgi:hypothetical protein
MYVFHDCHVHLTDYIQQGPDLRRFLALMGDVVGRAALFGIPSQQSWSFTDAHIAMQYRALPTELQARLDPAITGFTPADVGAADHIRRALETFPGVFTGIGELAIHKEFNDHAVDRIFALAGEVGLLVLIHCDIATAAMKALLERHPKTTCILAHLGLGRMRRPVKKQAQIVESIVKDPAFDHVQFDISWDELAEYLDDTPETAHRAADLLRKYPDRFLFGTDEVAPTERAKYTHIFETYQPLWHLLDPQTIEKVGKANFERLFDEARNRVRAWERLHTTRPAATKRRSRPTPRAVLAANDNHRPLRTRTAHR